MNQTKLKSKLHRYLKLNYRFYTLIWIMLDISQRQFLQSANQHAKKSDALKWQQQPKGECMQLANKKTKFALYIVDSTNNKSFGSSEKWIHSLFHHDRRVAPFLIVCCCCFAIITKKNDSQCTRIFNGQLLKCWMVNHNNGPFSGDGVLGKIGTGSGRPPSLMQWQWWWLKEHCQCVLMYALPFMKFCIKALSVVLFSTAAECIYVDRSKVLRDVSLCCLFHHHCGKIAMPK